MSDRIGTCSSCGGSVVVSTHADNPTPHCVHCGAIPAITPWPVIPMERKPGVSWQWDIRGQPVSSKKSDT